MIRLFIISRLKVFQIYLFVSIYSSDLFLFFFFSVAVMLVHQR